MVASRQAKAQTQDVVAVVAVAALVMLTFGEGVLLGVVPTAVAGIGQLFGTAAGRLNWVSTVQLVSTGVCTPVLSRLGDRWGYSRLLRISALTAAAGGVLMAAAPTFAVLLAGRALQGPVGAFTPLAVGILRGRLGGDRLRVGISAVVAGLTAGSAVGLVAAAEVYRASGQVRAVLWIAAAFLLLSAAATLVIRSPARAAAVTQIDWLGGLSLGAGVAALLIVLADGERWGWSSASILGWSLAAFVGLTVWVAVELRVADPLIDLRIMSRRAVAPFYAASLTIGVAFFGASTATTTFMASSRKTTGYGFGLDVTSIAYVGLPGAVAVILAVLCVPPLAGRVGHRATVCFGCGALLIGYLLLAVGHSALWQLVLASCVADVGVGLVSGAMPVVLIERAPARMTGIATGMFITGRAVGGSIAGAGFVALLSRWTLARGDTPRESAYVTVWLICAGAALMSLVVVSLATRRWPPGRPVGGSDAVGDALVGEHDAGELHA